MSKAARPAWLIRHVQTCRTAFGIGHTGFALTVRLVDKPGDDHAHCPRLDAAATEHET